MSEITAPNPRLLEIVEQQYRHDKDVSKEQKTQIASLMTRSLAEPRIRKTVEGIQEANKARDDLKAKYEKNGVRVLTEFDGGDLGELTKITVKAKDKSTELSAGEEFEAFKRIYDKRASQVKALHFQVLRIAAKEDLSAKVALRAGGMLYTMACSGELNRELLESIEKREQESGKQTHGGADETMQQRALDTFKYSVESLPAPGPRALFAATSPPKGADKFSRRT